MTDAALDLAHPAAGPKPLARVYGEPFNELPRDLYIPPEALEVFLDTFEGPLDLLLYLIRRQNINVLDIPMADLTRQGVFGHSMGGHGALTVALRNPGRFASVSAFAPIASPLNCPWGEKALSGYLGADRAAWRPYDACALIADGARVPEILVDQGDADQFLAEQLKPELLRDACADAGIDLTLRIQPGYDHSYHFISTFMADHIGWHAKRLAA